MLTGREESLPLCNTQSYITAAMDLAIELFTRTFALSPPYRFLAASGAIASSPISKPFPLPEPPLSQSESSEFVPALPELPPQHRLSITKISKKQG